MSKFAHRFWICTSESDFKFTFVEFCEALIYISIFCQKYAVLGSDVIYSEEAVIDLIETLVQLCGPQTTIILAGELRNGRNFSFGIKYHSNLLCQGVKDLFICRCHPGILFRSSDEGVCHWSHWSITIASRLLQLTCHYVCSSEKVNEMEELRLMIRDVDLKPVSHARSLFFYTVRLNV